MVYFSPFPHFSLVVACRNGELFINYLDDMFLNLYSKMIEYWACTWQPYQPSNRFEVIAIFDLHIIARNILFFSIAKTR